MSVAIEQSQGPVWAATLRHACPRCRADIALGDAGRARCAACGFEARFARGVHGFVATDGPVDEWQAVFENLASGPSGDTSVAVEYRSPIQQQYLIAAFKAAIGNLAAGARILDVGCGNGMFWQALTAGRPAVGVDYSAGMCLRAHQRGMVAYQAEALALPFAADQFDLVYCAELAQYVDDLHGLCAELARVCRPGGRVVISTLNRSSALRRLMQIVRVLNPRKIDPLHETVLQRTGGEMAAAAQGLPLVVERVYWTHFPFPWVRATATARSALAPLASNIVVEFIKPSRDRRP